MPASINVKPLSNIRILSFEETPNEVSWTACRSKTLLHFVAREVAKNATGGGVALKAALPQCSAAVRLALPATRAELADLARGLRDSATIAETIPIEETESAAFRQVLAGIPQNQIH